MALRGLVSSAIDVSDGLLSDLGHLLESAQLGAELDYEALPLSAAGWQRLNEAPEQLARLLDGGDDYALCFCFPPRHRAQLEAGLGHEDVFRVIGRVSETAGIHCRDARGKQWMLAASGYEHFKQET